MKFIIYPILYLIAIFPIQMIRLFSVFIAFIIGKVFKYREKVVDKNLRKAFPEKDNSFYNQTKKKFYKHYTQVLFETIKLLTVNQNYLLKQVRFQEDEDFKKLINEEKGAMIISGHLGNFEWGGQAFATFVKHPIFTVYRKFSAGFWEQIMINIRQKFKVTMVAAPNIIRTIFQKKDQGYYVVFLNDQSPSKGRDFIWVDFLGSETKFFVAPAKIAKKFGLPVYFLNMWYNDDRTYTVEAKQICQNAKDLDENEIIIKYAQFLEESIHKTPYNWLWSHKRWKVDKEGNKFY